MTRKKLFILIAAAIVILGIIGGVYYFYLAPKGATLTVGDPFGTLGGGVVGDAAIVGEDGTANNAGTEFAPRLIRITEGPVAEGTAAFSITYPDPTATTTASGTVPMLPDTEVRYIERASGNIYAYKAHERTLTRISNKTLPGVQVASWVADGSRAYAQFLSRDGATETTQTFMLPANAGGDGGYLLEQNLAQATVAGTSTLFTLLAGSTGSVGTIAAADGTGARTLFTSVLSSLTVHPTRGALYAATKAAARTSGYAFSINRTTGAFSRILGPYRGLAILPSPSGASVLFSYTDNGTYRLSVLDTASRVVVSLPVATFAEKCTWSADGLTAYCAVPTSLTGTLPDDWYQGARATSDRIWKIDLRDRVATLVVDPGELADISIDAVALRVDAAEDVLVWSDLHTGSLWLYDL